MEHETTIKPCRNVALVRWLAARWEWVCTCGKGGWDQRKAVCEERACNHKLGELGKKI